MRKQRGYADITQSPPVRAGHDEVAGDWRASKKRPFSESGTSSAAIISPSARGAIVSGFLSPFQSELQGVNMTSDLTRVKVKDQKSVSKQCHMNSRDQRYIKCN